MSDAPLVLIDASAARPPCTGVAWSMVELCNALAAERRGLRFVLAASHPELFAGLDGAPAAAEWRMVVHGRSRPRAVLGGTAGLARRLGASLVHALTTPAPLGVGCRLAVTVHDLAYRSLPGSVPSARRLWYRLTLARGLRRADAILVNSESTRDEVAGAFPACADRISTTPFGTPGWTEGRPLPEAVRPPDAPFLFVGALEPRKNLLGLIAAWDLLRDDLARAGRAADLPPLRVVGADGWCNSKILKELRSRARRGDVQLVGYRDRDGLWREYTSARALLLPSLHEGFGFPILEAMAARTPVITSDRGAMRELAAEAALLVDPESPRAIATAMRRLLDEPALAERLVRAGEMRRREYGWRETAERTVAAYLRLLDDRRNPAN